MSKFRLHANLLLAGTRDSEIIERFVKITEELCQNEEKSEEGKPPPPLVPIIKKGSSSSFLTKQPSKLTVTFAKTESEEKEKVAEKEESKESDEEKKVESPEDHARKERRPSISEDKLFRKVEKELVEEIAKKKKRRRKKTLREEELYTDKDRAAAISMGSKDIKQSLKMKKKQDRSRMLQIPEEARPGNFLALGNYEMLRGELHMALDCINKALELNPTEKNALVARSKCYILLGQPKNALEDAEKALEIDKKFVKAVYQKAEALYYLGDFEHSLMYYHRGLKVRPEHEGFQLGVKKAQKAIQDAIGSAFRGIKRPSTTSSKVSVKGNSKSETPSSSKLSSAKSTPTGERKEDEKIETKKETKTDGSGKSNGRRTSSSLKPKSANGSRLLRELRVDKEYLDNLLKDPDIRRHDNGNSAIVGYIQDAVNFLNSRQEFWRQHSPNYRKANAMRS